ncbi:MAG: glycoside hydrolase family 88 protein [Opitutaceae bacterium]|jgi:rhamnogalacturonyl hydrolase YesR|nr:glycoside hydrolase family 88 protein [Opitutaceae bacterium]
MQILPSRNLLLAAGLALAVPGAARAQPAATTPATPAAVVNVTWTPPAYPVPYAPASPAEIEAVMGRVVDYLETASPIRVVDAETKQPVASLDALPRHALLERGDFSLVSYEWGVTYAGMLHAAAATGDARYTRFVDTRLNAIRALAAHHAATPQDGLPRRYPLRSVIAPRTLDDSGAMAAAMLKAAQTRPAAGGDLRPLIDRYLAHISGSQKRLADGTLARDRPMPDSLWLDDLYMSVPALAQMGLLTGDARYHDDAARQILLFSKRMFVREKNLYMHGWVEGMAAHPAFHWGRANGWALLAKVELLSVLPETHPDRPAILALLRDHARGLAAAQGVNGLWHQLLDRPETYEETSASAMFVYGLARAINRGWLDPLAYGPVASVGWNAVTQKVNARGQVEGTCVGTGMAWEPVFYAYRPVSVYAAHGYGPVLLAGAEMIALRKGKGADAVVHDGGVHFGEVPARLW